MFTRKLGSGAQSTLCSGGHSCPDIIEMESGDFAIIGTDITDQAAGKLPPGCGCGPSERVIRIPRKTLVHARPEIPATL